MPRRAYPTDLTDEEWQVLEPLIPAAKPGGRPRSADVREIVNGIRYLLRSGGAWRLVPHEFPPWPTVYASFRRWEADGTWERMAGVLRRDLRVALGRRAEPSATVLDSQTVRTTEKGGLGAMTAGRKSLAASGISSSIRKDC
jgi:putative transposase